MSVCACIPGQALWVDQDVEVGLLHLLGKHREDLLFCAEVRQVVYQELQQQLDTYTHSVYKVWGLHL